jgi:hypothetical protein
MYLPWHRPPAPKPAGLPGDEPLHAAWQVVFDGYQHTAPLHNDDDTSRMLRTYLGDVLFSFSLALVREAELRKRCRRLEAALAARGQP